MSSPVPAACAAGPYAANTPAPIIDPSPMNTASPRPSRRSSVTSDAVVTRDIELHRRRDQAAGVSDLLLGGGGHHVLPGHEVGTAHVQPPERPRHEPDMEVRTPVPPAVEVHPSDVTERQDCALDAAADTAEGSRHLRRHVGEGVEVGPRGQPYRPGEAGLPGVVERPGVVGPD